ncbi:MAG: hypothetical protein FWH17_01390 [Oscillospiraceae bacterium]|nr:hypothetical protein [Oscillospiraceae bacterium]
MGIEYYIFALFVAALVCVIALICKMLFSDVKRQRKLLDERETEILHLYNSVETIMEEFQDQAKATIDELKMRENEYRAAMHNMESFRLPAEAFKLPPELEKREQALERIPRTLPLDANIRRAAGEVIERAERFIINDTPPQVSEPVLPGASAPVGASAPASVPAPAPAPPAYTPIFAASQPAGIAPMVTATIPASKPEAKQAVFQKFFDDAAEAPAAASYAPAEINGSRSADILALAAEGKTDVEIASTLGITRNEVQLVIGLTK